MHPREAKCYEWVLCLSWLWYDIEELTNHYVGIELDLFLLIEKLV